jgi:hypothetical protein
LSNLVEIYLRRAGSSFCLVDTTENLRTTDGIDYAAKQLGGAATSGVAVWMGLASSSFTPTANHRALGSITQGDQTIEFTSNGLARAASTYAHTAGVTSYTLTRLFTYTGGLDVTVYGLGEFTSQVASGSVMFLETLMSSSQHMSTNDQLAVVHTVQI